MASEVVFVAFADEDVLGEMIVAIDAEVECIDFGTLALVEGVEIFAWLGEITAVEVVIIAFANGFFEFDMFLETYEIEGLLLDIDTIATAEIGAEGDGVVAIMLIDNRKDGVGSWKNTTVA